MTVVPTMIIQNLPTSLPDDRTAGDRTNRHEPRLESFESCSLVGKKLPSGVSAAFVSDTHGIIVSSYTSQKPL